MTLRDVTTYSSVNAAWNQLPARTDTTPVKRSAVAGRARAGPAGQPRLITPGTAVACMPHGSPRRHANISASSSSGLPYSVLCYMPQPFSRLRHARRLSRYRCFHHMW